jgi:hypothetical protein
MKFVVVAVAMNITFFWAVTPWSLVEISPDG